MTMHRKIFSCMCDGDKNKSFSVSFWNYYLLVKVSVGLLEVLRLQENMFAKVLLLLGDSP